MPRTLSALVAIAVLMITAWYGVSIEPTWLEVRRHKLKVDSVNESVTLVQASDLHLQNDDAYNLKVAQAINDSKAQIVVFTGDLIDDAGQLDVLQRFLNDIHVPIKVAIPGNWEYWSRVDSDRLQSILRQSGVQWLINRCVSLQVNQQVLHVIGIDDFTAGQPDLLMAQRQCQGETPRVLLQHSPGLFDTDPPRYIRAFDLILSGHTHGGQVTAFGWPLYTPVGSGRFNRGWYNTGWGPLYVSKGIGTSVLPLRLGARPEIAVFELHGDQQ